MPIVIGADRVSATNYHVPVEPPDPTPPVLGLLRASRTVDPEDADVARHWPMGIAFLPHTGWQAEVLDTVSKKTSNGAYPGYTSTFPQATRQSYVPFVIEHAERASSIGFEAFPWEDRAKKGLISKTPSALEYEFWTGEQAKANGWPNHYLAMPNTGAGGPVVDLTPGSGPVNPRRALGYLEQALANAGTAAPSGAQAVTNVSTAQPMGAGRRGMIHCLPEIIPQLDSQGLVYPSGTGTPNVLQTVLGTAIIPGSGYPGTGPGGVSPAANTSWLYATSWVYVRLGDPALVDPDYLTDLKRSDNTVTVQMQRPAVAYWDHVAHFAINALLEGPDGI